MRPRYGFVNGRNSAHWQLNMVAKFLRRHIGVGGLYGGNFEIMQCLVGSGIKNFSRQYNIKDNSFDSTKLGSEFARCAEKDSYYIIGV